MDRRNFIRYCAAGAAAGTHATLAAKNLQTRFYARAQLVDERDRPLNAASLAVGQNYVFHYPFAATPCFLLNLGKATAQNVALKTGNGDDYLWPGGVGPGRSIVGYSAICSHQLTYPTRQISFISFREQSPAGKNATRNTIHCCSEHSEYDPASGARVVGGPAPQPLAAILLEYDVARDALYALGTLGGEVFNAFFAKYEMKLALELGAGRAQQRITARSAVTVLSNYCKQQVRC